MKALNAFWCHGLDLKPNGATAADVSLIWILLAMFDACRDNNGCAEDAREDMVLVSARLIALRLKCVVVSRAVGDAVA